MKNVFHAGIVGCGKIGSGFADDPKMMGDIFTHAEAYTFCEDTVLSAVCDIDSLQAEKCGNRWMVPGRYTDLKEMVRNEYLDILSISTPDPTHYQVLKEALANSSSIKAILCEKPLATNLDDAKEIVEEANEREVILSVMYMRRHAKNYQSLKEFISSGQLGDIQGINGWYTKGVRHNGTHWFDALRFLVGEVEWVMAWNILSDHLDDPTLDVIMGMEMGPIASLRACDSKAFTIFEMDIMGTDGRMRIIDSGYVMEYSIVCDSKRYSGYKELERSPVSLGNRRNLMLHAVEDIVQALRTGSDVKCSGEDGIAALKIAEVAVKSANSGKLVKII